MRGAIISVLVWGVVVGGLALLTGVPPAEAYQLIPGACASLVIWSLFGALHGYMVPKLGSDMSQTYGNVFAAYGHPFAFLGVAISLGAFVAVGHGSPELKAFAASPIYLAIHTLLAGALLALMAVMNRSSRPRPHAPGAMSDRRATVESHDAPPASLKEALAEQKSEDDVPANAAEDNG